MGAKFPGETVMRFDSTLGKQAERAKRGMNMKKVIAFIVFSSVSCVVAAASALWERGRRFVHDVSFAAQTIKKRYGDI